MLQHGNLRQCSLSLCPWMLHCGCRGVYSVGGSPQILCAACYIINHLLSYQVIKKAWWAIGMYYIRLLQMHTSFQSFRLPRYKNGKLLKKVWTEQIRRTYCVWKDTKWVPISWSIRQWIPLSLKKIFSGEFFTNRVYFLASGLLYRKVGPRHIILALK